MCRAAQTLRPSFKPTTNEMNVDPNIWITRARAVLWHEARVLEAHYEGDERRTPVGVLKHAQNCAQAMRNAALSTCPSEESLRAELLLAEQALTGYLRFKSYPAQSARRRYAEASPKSIADFLRDGDSDDYAGRPWTALIASFERESRAP